METFRVLSKFASKNHMTNRRNSYRAPLVAGVATGNNSSRRLFQAKLFYSYCFFVQFCILSFCISQNVLINEFMMKYAYGAGLIEIFIHL